MCLFYVWFAFDDHFVSRMSSDSSPKPPIHPSLSSISWLIGKWRGHGCGVYQTIQPFEYNEEIDFDHCGKPFLSYNARSWSTDGSKTPMHYESGYLIVQPNTSTVAFMLAQNTGLSEVEEGEIKDKEIHLMSHSIGRMPFAKEPKVTKTERTYKQIDQDTVEFIMNMETETSAHQKHLHITYKRVKED